MIVPAGHRFAAWLALESRGSRLLRFNSPAELSRRSGLGDGDTMRALLRAGDAGLATWAICADGSVSIVLADVVTECAQ